MKKIYTTKNYDMFKSMIDNREVKSRTTNKIVASVKKVGWITNPIICNEKMEVIDGQNRLEALKILGLPVDYIVEKGLTIDHCRALNINQSNWATMDWVKSYADGGNVSYRLLLNLVDAFPDMKLKVITFALVGQAGKITGGDLNKGKFECTVEQYNEANKKLSWLRGAATPLRNIDGNRWAIECAALYAYSDPEVDNKRLIEKISKYYSIANPVTSIDSALGELERIYNFKNSNKVYIKTNYLKATDSKVLKIREKANNERRRRTAHGGYISK